jgi:hypothetical protein
LNQKSELIKRARQFISTQTAKFQKDQPGIIYQASSLAKKRNEGQEREYNNALHETSPYFIMFLLFSLLLLCPDELLLLRVQPYSQETEGAKK